MKTLGLLAALLAATALLFFFVLGEDRSAPGRADLVDRPAVGPGAFDPEETADAGTLEKAAADPSGATQRPLVGRSAAERDRPTPKPAGARIPTRTLMGMVVADSGPVQGAQVLLFADGEPVQETNVNRQGKFELTFPLPQEDAILRVTQRGYASYEKALGSQRIEGQQHLGNIFLRPGTVLSGVVVDGSGRPIRDARVQLSTLRGRSIQAGVGEQISTGVDGRFQFPAAPSGTVVLTARADGFGERTIDHRHLPGVEAKLVLVPGEKLEFLVVDDTGHPLEDVRVTVRSTGPGTVPREEKTDAQGLVTFDGLAAREWNVRTNKPGYKPTGLSSVHAGTGRTRLQLIPWPCVTGKILTPGGEAPPEGTKVHALPSAARGDMVGRLPGGMDVNEDGSFRVCDLRTGEYRLHILAPGFADTTSEVFRVGDVGDIRLGQVTLQKGGELELRLLRMGKPVARVRAEILRAAPLPAQLWADPRVPEQEGPGSDAEGNLVIRNLTVGNVWLILRGEDIVPKTVGPFSVSSSGSARPSPIELVPGARIRGLVVRTDGTPVRRARIDVKGTVASIPYTASEENGRFLTPPLPPGDYRVGATSVVDGKLVEAESVDLLLQAGEDSEAKLVLMDK